MNVAETQLFHTWIWDTVKGQALVSLIERGWAGYMIPIYALTAIYLSPQNLGSLKMAEKACKKSDLHVQHLLTGQWIDNSKDETFETHI